MLATSKRRIDSKVSYFLHSVCSSHYVTVQLWQSKKHYTKNPWFFYFDFQQEATVGYN